MERFGTALSISFLLLFAVIEGCGPHKNCGSHGVMGRQEGEVGTKALKRFSDQLNDVKHELKDLHKADIADKEILSPAMADAELQKLEAVLGITPAFMQLRSLKSLKRHRILARKDDNDDPGLENEEQKEGEQAAEDYSKDHSGPTSVNSEDPKQFVKEETNVIMKIADDAASIATGVDDYTGYTAQEEKKRAKAQADLVLAAGYGPIVAEYSSGQSDTQIKSDENEAKVDKEKEGGDSKEKGGEGSKGEGSKGEGSKGEGGESSGTKTI